MLTLIRRLISLLRKDFRLLANYKKSHPHFFWYLGADALLSIALVFGGHSLYTNMTSDEHILQHVGAEVMTSQEVIEHVHENNVLAYWLGSFPGYEYTMNHADLDVADIFYWQKGSFSDENQQFLYEVETYKNQKAWDRRVHTVLATTNTETITINKVITIEVNRRSMRGVIVTFTNHPEIVGIAYPAPQSLEAIIKNVKSLELIQ